MINQHLLWMIKDRSNPFMLDNKEFISKFRLSKSATEFLCECIKPFMKENIKGYAREIQVCIEYLNKTFTSLACYMPVIYTPM